MAFGEGIVSTNVVGYMNVPNDVSGYCQRGATFIACGSATDSYDIQSIIPVDAVDDGEYIGDGDITIQFTGNRGALEGAFAYYGDDEYDDDCPAGWYNEDTDERVTYSFEPGQGFKVNAATACYLKFPAL